MTIDSYHKFVGTGVLMTGLVAAGAVLLGLGLSWHLKGSWDWHIYEIGVGSTLLVAGVGAIIALARILHSSNSISFDTAQDALKADSKKKIWTYASNNGQEVMVIKTENGEIKFVKPEEYSEIAKCFTRRVYCLPHLLQ